MGFNPALTVQEVEAALAGGYTALVPITVGGQGAVFRALGDAGRDAVEVALKIYHPDQLEERSRREVKALRLMRGETIAALHDAGTCTIRGERCPYVATAFVHGQPLSFLIEAGPMQLGQIARVGQDIASAIQVMWAARIVHRDIKPANIMVRDNGRAVLIDLGLARHLTLTSLTTSGMTWGTPGYLSPEQARGTKQLSCKSDVFSLGIVLQECLLGRHPTNRRQAEILDGGPRTGRLRPDLPSQFTLLVDSMVGQRPVSRPTPELIVERFVPFLA